MPDRLSPDSLATLRALVKLHGADRVMLAVHDIRSEDERTARYFDRRHEDRITNPATGEKY